MGGQLAELFDGINLKNAIAAAVNCLERHRDLINALNVFPVPDGDTGTNLLLTMRAGLESCADPTVADLGQSCDKLSEGLFWGSRGNSGVILSEFFKGFSAALAGVGGGRPSDLTQAFAQGADAAYQAVSQPVEGTMLSVIRAVAEAVGQAHSDENISGNIDYVGEANISIESVWETAFVSAKAALALTPIQLPVLAEAGVVDAGGLGMVAIFGGIYSYFSRLSLDMVDLGINSFPTGVPDLNQSFVDASHGTQWGYCTQFLIEGERLELGQIRDDFCLVSDSVVVVGDDQRVRVHVHDLDPGPALSYGVSLGQLSQIQIENMSTQNRIWANPPKPSRVNAATEIMVVAVSLGEGFHRLFLDSGCAAAISGGQTMNPSVGQILYAAHETGAKHVIILPNNKNVVPAARQAASEQVAGGEAGLPTLHVVPTQSLPQGVAAALAFNPEQSLEHNLQAMAAASEDLVSIEVAQAVRNTNINGVPVPKGHFIGLINEQMVVADEAVESAMLATFSQLGLTNDLVVTLYWGEGSTQRHAETLAAELVQQVPGIQVDLVFGGQPYYPYLASVE